MPGLGHDPNRRKLYSRPCHPSRAATRPTVQRRRRPRRLRAPDRRPVHDQHRHRRRGRHGGAGGGAGARRAASWCASPSTTRTPPRRSPGSSRRWTGSASPCRSSATSTTTATCCSPGIPTAPGALAKYRINPGNVGRQAARRELPRHHRGRPARTTSRCGSASTGARSTRALLTEMMDANARAGRSAGRPRRDDGGDGRERAPIGGAGRGRGTVARPDHPQRQGVRRAGPGRRLPDARGPLRLPAAPRADRGGTRRQGHHRQHGGAQHPAAGGHRRHDPRVADARARRRPDRRGAGGAAGAPDRSAFAASRRR